MTVCARHCHSLYVAKFYIRILFPLCSPWVFFALLCTVHISFFCPPYELKHIDLGVQHGSVKESCSIYAFAFIAINHRSLVCEVKFEIKCFALRSNAFQFKNKSLTNTLKRNQNMYLYHFFDCYPE